MVAQDALAELQTAKDRGVGSHCVAEGITRLIPASHCEGSPSRMQRHPLGRRPSYCIPKGRTNCSEGLGTPEAGGVMEPPCPLVGHV